jgi:hypothetical protein
MKTSDFPRLPPSPLGAGILALVVMVQFAAASWLWPLMYSSWLRDKGLYRSVWASSGFRNLPIEKVAEGLNRRLPVETPIQLGPALQRNDQWSQRIKEGLYPRRVQPNGPAILDLGTDGEEVARGPQGTFVLRGQLPQRPVAPKSGSVDFSLSWGRVALRLFAAFGWGALLAIGLARLRRPKELHLPLLAGAGLAAPVLVGVLGTIATLVQKPLPFTILAVAGTLLGAAVLVPCIRRLADVGHRRRALAWMRQLETWGMLLLGGVLVRHMSLWPIIGWDGRSIWLFRAKQIAHNGFVTTADAINPLNFAMDYPLLLPTWLAHFGAVGPMREREVGVGGVLLHLGLVACLWAVSRQRLGRFVGAAFTAAVFVVTTGTIERGYADGLVTLFLLNMMFCLDSDDQEPYGWLAALGACLTKREGLVFAVMASGLFLLAHPRFRARRLWRRLLPTLALLPALAYLLWTKAVGIREGYSGAKIPVTFQMACDRLGTIWFGVAAIARESKPIATGFAALASYLALEAVGRRSWLTRVMVGTAVGIVLFSYFVMLTTPYDLSWQVSTAMERLLSHAVLVLLGAVLVALTTLEGSQSPRPAETFALADGGVETAADCPPNS